MKTEERKTGPSVLQKETKGTKIGKQPAARSRSTRDLSEFTRTSAFFQFVADSPQALEFNLTDNP
jgi:hypothetical protein